jgi:hypothetical protein
MVPVGSIPKARQHAASRNAGVVPVMVLICAKSCTVRYVQPSVEISARSIKEVTPARPFSEVFLELARIGNFGFRPEMLRLKNYRYVS